MASERFPPASLMLSARGADVIADREGYSLMAYLDTVAHPDVWTIGIGHTSNAGPPEVYEGMTITEMEMHDIFRNDCARFREEALSLVKVPVAQHEFDSLASFIFNLGTTQFESSTALERLNEGDYVGCAEAMTWWNKPPEIIPRRRGEVDQFVNGTYIARIDEDGNPA